MGIDDVRIGNSEGAALPKVARILIADDHALVREGLRTELCSLVKMASRS